MAINVEIPAMGESITEAVIVQWLKADGDRVAADEPICELETDKATFDLPAPGAGVLHTSKQQGETVRVGDTIAQIDGAEAQATDRPEESEAPAAHPAAARSDATDREEAQAADLTAEPPASEPPREAAPEDDAIPPSSGTPGPHLPAQESAREQAGPDALAAVGPSEPARPSSTDGIRRVPMSKIRRRIAERLVRAQHTAAMLTTFNEIDMSAVIGLRERNQRRFTEAHGVPLGLTSFFARACVLALKQFPALNAEIERDEIIYHEAIHVGIAVSTDRGLVVPVLRHVEQMSFARIEAEIKRVAAAARGAKLSIQDLSGGTFTISNGGIFGSLLSTPILNPPQTGILGMHAIQKRPVVVDDRIEARPMMYVALTYDHRLVDGKDSVSFLVRIKELLEDPARMMLEI